jgi:hypothetical protein
MSTKIKKEPKKKKSTKKNSIINENVSNSAASLNTNLAKDVSLTESSNKQNNSNTTIIDLNNNELQAQNANAFANNNKEEKDKIRNSIEMNKNSSFASLNGILNSQSISSADNIQSVNAMPTSSSSLSTNVLLPVSYLVNSNTDQKASSKSNDKFHQLFPSVPIEEHVINSKKSLTLTL